MKTKLGVLIILLAAALARAQTNNLTALLQQGLFEEQANGNLDAAILDYQSLATQFDKDRQIAATAVFRLGECYRMQGKTNEAAAEYQRILTDFPDQTTLATLSRQDLTGLGIFAQASASTSITSSAVLDNLQSQYVLLKAQLEQARQETNDEVVAELFNDNKELAEGLRLELSMDTPYQAALQDAKASGHPEQVADAERNLKEHEQQVEKARQQILDFQEIRLQSLESAIKQARAGQTAQPPTASGVSPTLSDEDQEIQRIQTMIQNSPDLINAPVNGSTPLEKAAANGWLKVAAFLLDHGADVNARRGTALFDAVQAGNRAMVEFLLAHGADVNAEQENGDTPLAIAARKGFQAVTETLLASHADVNAQNNSGTATLAWTPLVSAMRGGNLKIVQMLLAAGAKVNLKDSNGETVLNYAIGTSPEIVQALLNAGTDPNTEDAIGRTPLSCAVERDSPQVVKMLLAAKADPNAGTLDAPLLCAIHSKDAASAELLLQAGANPNAKELMSWAISFGNSEYPQGTSVTPLFLAVLNKQFPMAQLLLKFKADPNDSQTDGNPVLFDALGDTNILAALLDAGGKADSRTSYGWPLLDGAVSEKNFTAVQMLLLHGANASVRSAPDAETGYTPLHIAALQLADPKIFELLLDNHADPNVRGSDGKTPLDLLKETIGQGSPAGQMVNGISPEDEEKAKLAAQLADLLRQHGALDNLPDWNSIKVSRPSANFSMIIFQKSTNDWNHFTLLELLGEMRNGFESPSSGFPDLAHLVIVRPGQTGAETQKIKVNLLNATNGIDCSKDIPLQFGDTVEIPEREHTLAAPEIFLTKDQAATIMDYLKSRAGNVTLIVDGGQTVQLPLEPLYASSIGHVLQGNAAQAVLTSDSDLSRIKVTRRNPSTGRTDEWILDCSDHQSPNNGGLNYGVVILNDNVNFSASNQNAPLVSSGLWLRNGDVIEVPEKP